MFLGVHGDLLFSKAICSTNCTTHQQQHSHGWLSISFWGEWSSVVFGFQKVEKGDEHIWRYYTIASHWCFFFQFYNGEMGIEGVQ